MFLGENEGLFDQTECFSQKVIFQLIDVSKRLISIEENRPICIRHIHTLMVFIRTQLKQVCKVLVVMKDYRERKEAKVIQACKDHVDQKVSVFFSNISEILL